MLLMKWNVHKEEKEGMSLFVTKKQMSLKVSLPMLWMWVLSVCDSCMIHFLNFKTSVKNVALFFVTIHRRFWNALHVVVFSFYQVWIDKTYLWGEIDETSLILTSPSPAERFGYHWDVSCFEKQPQQWLKKKKIPTGSFPNMVEPCY